MTGWAHVAFDAMPWTQGAHPLEQKKVATSHPLTLLRFEPGFADDNWCPRAHVIYVTRGRLELTFRDGATLVGAGQACWLDPGAQHQVKNPDDEPVELFIVSDVVRQTPEASS